MSKLFIVFVIFTIVLIQVCDCKKEKGTPHKAPRGDFADDTRNSNDNAGHSTPDQQTPQKRKAGRPVGSTTRRVADGDDPHDKDYYPSN
uniref:Candidate secreted effector n=1 Tax=Meloidogyne incognita TaxID=6306 RepID=A0A914MBX1_MELIC